MTITVGVTPEVQAEIARQAAAHGRAVEAYAASLLEEAVRLPTARTGRLSTRNGRFPRPRIHQDCAKGLRWAA